MCPPGSTRPPELVHVGARPTVEYELTELGRELLPAVDAIVSVGERLKQRRAAAAGVA